MYKNAIKSRVFQTFPLNQLQTLIEPTNVSLNGVILEYSETTSPYSHSRQNVACFYFKSGESKYFSLIGRFFFFMWTINVRIKI